MSEEKTSKVKMLVPAFAIGTMVGAVIALLYAPASGRETRELLSRKGRELKEKVGESVTENKDKLIAAAKAGKEAMSEKSGEDSKA